MEMVYYRLNTLRESGKGQRISVNSCQCCDDEFVGVRQEENLEEITQSLGFQELKKKKKLSNYYENT